MSNIKTQDVPRVGFVSLGCRKDNLSILAEAKDGVVPPKATVLLSGVCL